LVVARETGLSMDTLRVWERRYGFPKPERRPGSNRRLYARVDVERLVAIRRALDRGYRIGDVIDKSLPELASLGGQAAAASGTPGGADTSVVAVRGLIELLEREDIVRLESELRKASVALGPRAFVTDLAQPFAVAVGDAWASGEIAVHHEHVATECLITCLRGMLAAYQDVEARPHVLLATLPGELHGLALLFVALYLGVSGAKPRLLGPSTPPEEIAAAARAFRVDVVGVSISPAASVADTRQALHMLERRLPRDLPLWVGGAGAPKFVKPGRARLAQSWSDIDKLLVATR
jgi:DNA-binding transcriptional MerR regulator/methylmalonyl-CoA mutase cobalamin-binding subunit